MSQLNNTCILIAAGLTTCLACWVTISIIDALITVVAGALARRRARRPPE